jgi:hypothetical protein
MPDVTLSASRIAQLVDGVHGEEHHDSSQGCIEVNSYDQVEHDVLQYEGG